MHARWVAFASIAFPAVCIRLTGCALDVCTHIFGFMAPLVLAALSVLCAAVSIHKLDGADSLFTGVGCADIAIIARAIIGDENTAIIGVAGVVCADIFIIAEGVRRAFAGIANLVIIGVYLFGIGQGWAIVRIDTNAITVQVFTAAKAVSKVPVVAGADRATHCVFAGCLGIAAHCSQFTFIDVFAGETVSFVALEAGALITSFGICATGVVRTWSQCLYQFTGLANTGTIQSIIPRLRSRACCTEIIPTILVAEKIQTINGFIASLLFTENTGLATQDDRFCAFAFIDVVTGDAISLISRIACAREASGLIGAESIVTAGGSEFALVYIVTGDAISAIPGIACAREAPRLVGAGGVCAAGVQLFIFTFIDVCAADSISRKSVIACAVITSGFIGA